jgi:hypothetical protein
LKPKSFLHQKKDQLTLHWKRKSTFAREVGNGEKTPQFIDANKIAYGAGKCFVILFIKRVITLMREQLLKKI